jgi:uncharacterized protein (DUF58 family)
MIYPTRRAIILTALGAPAALIIGLFAPGYWVVAGGWLVLVLGLCLVDALRGPSRASCQLAIDAPQTLGMPQSGSVTVRADFARTFPSRAEFAIETNARLTVAPDRLSADFVRGQASAGATLGPVRRGTGEILALWLRWQGPWGLVWKQLRETTARSIAIVPNLVAVKDEAIRLFARDAQFGIKAQLETGEGAEFHALREMAGAMDTRCVDWKQSARHGKLLGKEFRTERNHPVVLAIDAGRLMCEPLLGVPRIDRAINGALMLAYVSLRLGDRVGVFSFDAKPRLFTGVISGAGAFARLQRLVAGLDYSADETNYTLGLTQLGAQLSRRSLIVVFTDFADATSAELMLENLGRLLRKHVVLFVVLRDEELEAIVRREPLRPEDVTAAVASSGLLQVRDVVVGRLRRMGVHVLDAPAERIGPALISAFLDLKRRDVM